MTPLEVFNDAEHWLRRAKEARNVASLLSGAEQQQFLNIAADYEELAEKALSRLEGQKKAREE